MRQMSDYLTGNRGLVRTNREHYNCSKTNF